MGSRKEPGDPGYRAEVTNPAVEKNKQAWADKGQTAPEVGSGYSTTQSQPVSNTPEGSVNFPPSPEGSVNFPPSPEGSVNYPPAAKITEYQNRFFFQGQQITEASAAEMSKNPTAQPIYIDPSEGDPTQSMENKIKENIRKDIEMLQSGAMSYAKGVLLPQLAVFGGNMLGLTKYGAMLEGTAPSTITTSTATKIPGLTIGTNFGKIVNVINTQSASKFKVGQKALGFIKSMTVAVLGTAAFSYWGGQEEIGSTAILMRDTMTSASFSGDFTAADEALALYEQTVTDINGLETYEHFIPWVSAIKRMHSYVKTSQKAVPIWKMANSINKETYAKRNGVEGDPSKPGYGEAQNIESSNSNFTFDQDKQAIENRRKEESEKELILLYNEERKKMVEWERQAYVDGRNEDAAFWAAEREKQYALEEQNRIALAAFWEDYRKEQQKIYEDSTPSKLSFGIV